MCGAIMVARIVLHRMLDMRLLYGSVRCLVAAELWREGCFCSATFLGATVCPAAVDHAAGAAAMS